MEYLPAGAMPQWNLVRLLPHLLSDESGDSRINRRFSGIAGPQFLPLGNGNDRWHDVELVVTPEGLSATWNGQSFSLPVDRLRRDVEKTTPKDLPGDLRLTFDGGGGLGLYVRKGSASFRSITVTPLHDRSSFSTGGVHHGDDQVASP